MFEARFFAAHSLRSANVFITGAKSLGLPAAELKSLLMKHGANPRDQDHVYTDPTVGVPTTVRRVYDAAYLRDAAGCASIHYVIGIDSPDKRATYELLFSLEFPLARSLFIPVSL
jgi:hypothetical protein